MERLEELQELGLHLVLPEPTAKGGRPNVGDLVAEAVENGNMGERFGVVVSGPDAMNREANNACARLSWEGRDVQVAVEKFGW